jgi:hypothetical protein
MDVSKYTESKQAGNVVLKRYGESFQCEKRQFNPETGAETTPAISTFTELELTNQQAMAVKLLASINEMIADLRALK